MSNYNNNSSDAKCVVQILVSFCVIVISIFFICKIVILTSEIKILEKINLKSEPHNSISITTDTNEGASIFIKDEKGLKFRKEDKSFARDEWIDKNGELFYFDTAGYGLNGDMKKEGQVYTFENGKLKNIKRDNSIVLRARKEYYSSIESSQYIVWLDGDEKEKGFYPIKYKDKNEDYEDYLGTANDKQFASTNMVKIYLNEVYYLAIGKGSEFSGRLYRMRPGAEHKEYIGKNVTGFIVLSEDVVYYVDNEHVIKAKNWNSEEVNILTEEDKLSDALNSVPIEISTNSRLEKIIGNGLDETYDGIRIDDKVEKEITIINEDKMKGVRVNGPSAVNSPR